MSSARNKRPGRACQFAPFDALKGFREALAEKEVLPAPRPDWSEEREAELDLKLRSVKPGQETTIIYFENGMFWQVSGTVTRLEPDRRLLWVSDFAIPFSELCQIREPE